MECLNLCKFFVVKIMLIIDCNMPTKVITDFLLFDFKTHLPLTLVYLTEPQTQTSLFVHVLQCTNMERLNMCNFKKEHEPVHYAL